tara:strand:- start:2250 stop:2372 length:123 start_codon:yes stop_codon:yes gene_type:complete
MQNLIAFLRSYILVKQQTKAALSADFRYLEIDVRHLKRTK